MAVRPTTAEDLAVKDFRFGTDDFEDWVVQFESSVGLAHAVDDGAQKEALCKRWLPLKLDETAKAMAGRIDETRSWAEIKAKLVELFTDPQEKYNWASGRGQVVWDGVESFHSLATKIKRKVDRFGNAANKDMK